VRDNEIAQRHNRRKCSGKGATSRLGPG
jgi:hypothetical protein